MVLFVMLWHSGSYRVLNMELLTWLVFLCSLLVIISCMIFHFITDFFWFTGDCGGGTSIGCDRDSGGGTSSSGGGRGGSGSSCCSCCRNDPAMMIDFRNTFSTEAFIIIIILCFVFTIAPPPLGSRALLNTFSTDAMPVVSTV